MDSVLTDIINNFKHNNIYTKYSRILEDLCDYKYDKTKVNISEDTYKFIISYRIGEFEFIYYHILASKIDSSVFISELGDKKEKVCYYSLLSSIMKKIKKTTKNKLPSINISVLNLFMTRYNIKNADDCYLFFSILNSFTLGECYNIRIINNNIKLVYQNLFKLINII